MAIATPQSASFNASTSLTPSPVIATVCPRDWSAWTIDRFWCGVTRPNTVLASTASANASSSSGGIVRGVDVVLPPGEAGASGDRADGDVVVAADHLDDDALVGEVLQRRGGVGAHDVLEQHERHRRDRRKRCVGAVAERAFGLWPGSAPVVPGVRALRPGLRSRLRSRRHHVLWCAEDPAAVVGEGHRAPLARRGERHAAGRCPGCRVLVCVLQCPRASRWVGVELGRARQARASISRMVRVADRSAPRRAPSCLR